jgi:hypothetical protein
LPLLSDQSRSEASVPFVWTGGGIERNRAAVHELFSSQLADHSSRGTRRAYCRRQPEERRKQDRDAMVVAARLGPRPRPIPAPPAVHDPRGNLWRRRRFLTPTTADQAQVESDGDASHPGHAESKIIALCLHNGNDRSTLVPDTCPAARRHGGAPHPTLAGAGGATIWDFWSAGPEDGSSSPAHGWAEFNRQVAELLQEGSVTHALTWDRIRERDELASRLWCFLETEEMPTLGRRYDLFSAPPDGVPRRRSLPAVAELTGVGVSVLRRQSLDRIRQATRALVESDTG